MGQVIEERREFPGPDNFNMNSVVATFQDFLAKFCLLIVEKIEVAKQDVAIDAMSSVSLDCFYRTLDATFQSCKYLRPALAKKSRCLYWKTLLPGPRSADL